MEEVQLISDKISQEAHEEAKIFWGVVFDEEIGDELRVTVIATGIGSQEERAREKEQKILPFEKPQEEKEERSVRTRRRSRILDYIPTEEELEIPAFLRRKAD